MLKLKIGKYAWYAGFVSPLVGMVYTRQQPITERAQQFLVLIMLL